MYSREKNNSLLLTSSEVRQHYNTFKDNLPHGTSVEMIPTRETNDVSISMLQLHESSTYVTPDILPSQTATEGEGLKYAAAFARLLGAGVFIRFMTLPIQIFNQSLPLIDFPAALFPTVSAGTLVNLYTFTLSLLAHEYSNKPCEKLVLKARIVSNILSYLLSVGATSNALDAWLNEDINTEVPYLMSAGLALKSAQMIIDSVLADYKIRQLRTATIAHPEDEARYHKAAVFMHKKYLFNAFEFGLSVMLPTCIMTNKLIGGSFIRVASVSFGAINGAYASYKFVKEAIDFHKNSPVLNTFFSFFKKKETLATPAVTTPANDNRAFKILRTKSI